MADSTIEFTIGGVGYISYLDIKSLKVADSLPANGDRCSFLLAIPSSALTSSGPSKPLCFQIVNLKIDGETEFEGPITSIEELPRDNIEVYNFQCECSDYAALLDRKLVAKQEMASDFAGTMIRDIISEYAPEFTTNNVNHGVEIPKQQFDHVSVGSVLDAIAQASGYNWYVDFEKDIHFFLSEDLPAPVSTLDIDTDLAVGGVTITEDISRLKNIVYLKDYTAKSSDSTTDTFIAEENKSFYKLNNFPFDWESMTVELDGESVDVTYDPTVDAEGTITGSESVVYACILNMGIRFPLSDLPSSGTTIDVTYFPEAKEQAIPVSDPDSIRMMKAREKSPFDGKHERVVSLSEMRVPDLSTIIGWGEIILDRLAWPILTGSFETVSGAYTGWKAGQSFFLQSAKRDLMDVKAYWKTGKKQNPRVYIQTVNKEYLPAGESAGTTTCKIRTQINFSTLSSEIAV